MVVVVKSKRFLRAIDQECDCGGEQWFVGQRDGREEGYPGVYGVLRWVICERVTREVNRNRRLDIDETFIRSRTE